MEKKTMDENTAQPPNPSSRLHSQYVDGFQIFGMLPQDSFRSAVNYKPRPDDTFVATYPKCGTTWVQHIMLLLFRRGEPITNQMEFFTSSPYLEMTGAEGVQNLPRPLALKTHLPYHLAPKSDEAKYVYITRNPKDCCVSYYHHMKDIHFLHGFTGTFDEFFELFLEGEVDYGDYFDHLLGWYAHRNDPNVLFLTYEQLKENTEETVLKIASFLDDKLYAEPLRSDPEKLKNVLKYSSFDFMKGPVNEGVAAMFSLPKEQLLKSDMPKPFKDLVAKLPSPPPGVEMPKSVNFIRKGTIGDWRNYFSEEQRKRLDEKFFDRTKGTDIPDLWKKYM